MNKKICILAIFMIYTTGVFSQYCGTCKRKPRVGFVDFQMPDLPETTDKKLEKNLYEMSQLSLYVMSYFRILDKCVEVIELGSNWEIGTEANWELEYLIFGIIKHKGDNFELKVYFTTACTKKILAESDALFNFSYGWNSWQTAHEAVAKMSPIINKIRNFESEQNRIKKLPLGGNLFGGRIDVMVENPYLKPGQQTDFFLEMKDCDGKVLTDQEINFIASKGGTITPATVITNAQGRAQAKFKLAANFKGKAFIYAISKPTNVKGCEDFYSGSAAISDIPELIVSVTYTKTGGTNVRMKGKDSLFSILVAEERDFYSITAKTTFFHYESPPDKENFQLEILRQDKDTSAKTIFIDNEGHSEYLTFAKSPELEIVPLGSRYKFAVDTAASVSSSELLFPWIALDVENGELQSFDINFDFADTENKKTPESGGFLTIRGDSTSMFITNIIVHPKSPYQKEYEIYYSKVRNDKNEFGVGSMTETAIVSIFIKK